MLEIQTSEKVNERQMDQKQIRRRGWMEHHGCKCKSTFSIYKRLPSVIFKLHRSHQQSPWLHVRQLKPIYTGLDNIIKSAYSSNIFYTEQIRFFFRVFMSVACNLRMSLLIYKESTARLFKLNFNIILLVKKKRFKCMYFILKEIFAEYQKINLINIFYFPIFFKLSLKNNVFFTIYIF